MEETKWQPDWERLHDEDDVQDFWKYLHARWWANFRAEAARIWQLTSPLKYAVPTDRFERMTLAEYHKQYPLTPKDMTMEKTESQNKQILKHLQSGRKITAYEALKVFGCLRLAARIRDLRDAGHAIKSELISENGKRFSEYSL
jgi:hypothetical protein